ncbi:MAG: GNAT family N-acetyltransferase [Pseudonocardiaceae bacterium]
MRLFCRSRGPLDHDCLGHNAVSWQGSWLSKVKFPVREGRRCACAAAGCLRCAMIGNGVVAVGRVVADDGWAGVFGMATLSHARGKGAARSVLAALADWVGAHEADRMYLQVESDNIRHSGCTSGGVGLPMANHRLRPWSARCPRGPARLSEVARCISPTC